MGKIFLYLIEDTIFFKNIFKSFRLAVRVESRDIERLLAPPSLVTKRFRQYRALWCTVSGKQGFYRILRSFLWWQCQLHPCPRLRAVALSCLVHTLVLPILCAQALFVQGVQLQRTGQKNMQNVGQRDKGNNHGIIHIHIFQNFSKIFTSAKKWLQR